MCISNLKNNNKVIADKDIPVLKVVKKKNGKLFSPIFDTEAWRIGEEKTINLSIILDLFDYPENLYRTTTGLYSFDKNCNPKYCSSAFSYSGIDLEVYEAVIPKGSEYIKDGNQYCSNKLKLVSIIKE